MADSMLDTQAKGLEIGTAKLIVGFEQGWLVVRNGYDNSVLLEGPLPKGGWNGIVGALVLSTPEGTGPMKETLNV